MKKLILAGILFGALDFAQADSFTINAPSGMIGTGALNGTYAYLWSVPFNQQVTSASITFNNVTETLAGSGNNISVDVGSFIGMAVGQSSAPTSGHYSTITDNDALGDAFHANTTGLHPTAINLGSETFAHLNVAQTWTFTFSALQILALNSDIAAGNWGFEIDPDCHFTVGGITFSATTSQVNRVAVPDQTTTAGLLGLTFFALLAFRRRLCLN